MSGKKFVPSDPSNHKKFLEELARFNDQHFDRPKKQKILMFISDWLGLKGKNRMKSFTAFRHRYIEFLPDNEQSKKFLIDNFTKYNDDFKLNFVYDETRFTTYNVLYFLKNMLRHIDYDLLKEHTEKYKRYTIIYKKSSLK